MDLLTTYLRKHFGWNDFKPGQKAVVQAILSGQDSLAVMPTGGGKSICYQLPALIRQGLVVVISPLVALMEDQVMQLNKRGILASCLHSGLNSSRRGDVFFSLQNDNLRLLYLAPERLKGSLVRDFLTKKTEQGKLISIAIDEAHCISAWGHDFRPDYRRLGEIRLLCPDVPFVALSATATPKVRADIIRLLNLKRPLVQVCSARRKNLQYLMRRRIENPLPEILKELNSTKGASLIYVRTRRSVELWSKKLRDVGIPAISYHAGLEPKSREKALKDFLGQSKPVLVATVAFGMGVDRADVGLVLHLNLPSSPEGYMQESGRAGRDGNPAKCLVFFSPGDRTRLLWAIQASTKRELNYLENADAINRKEIAQNQLRRMEAIAEGEMCVEQALLLVVGEVVAPCGECDKCVKNYSVKDWSEQALSVLIEIDQKKGIDINKLKESLESSKGFNRERWGWLARRLVHEELISETNNGNQLLFLRESGRNFIKSPWPLYYAA